jgi:hypothetical protein
MGRGMGLFFLGMSIFVFSGSRFKGIKDRMIEKELKKEWHSKWTSC